MRAYGLEAHRQQMVGGQHARRLLPPGIAERLDRLEAPPQQILGDRLHHHPAQPLPLVAGHDPGRHQLHGVRGDRAGGEGRGARHIRRRGVEHEARPARRPHRRPGRRIPTPAGRRRSRLPSPAPGVPAFTAASPLTGSSSQKTHERQRLGRSGRLSSVSGTSRRPMKASSSLPSPAASRAAVSALRSLSRLPTNPPTAPRPRPAVTSPAAAHRSHGPPSPEVAPAGCAIPERIVSTR